MDERMRGVRDEEKFNVECIYVLIRKTNCNAWEDWQVETLCYCFVTESTGRHVWKEGTRVHYLRAEKSAMP